MTTPFQVRSQPHREPIWPEAAIVFGVSLTVSWTILLAYGLVRLIENAF